MVPGPVPKHEATVAIGAFDEILVAHLQIHTRMPEWALTAVAADAGVVDRNDFRDFDGHGETHTGEEIADFSHCVQGRKHGLGVRSPVGPS